MQHLSTTFRSSSFFRSPSTRRPTFSICRYRIKATNNAERSSNQILIFISESNDFHCSVALHIFRVVKLYFLSLVSFFPLPRPFILVTLLPFDFRFAPPALTRSLKCPTSFVVNLNRCCLNVFLFSCSPVKLNVYNFDRKCIKR